MIRWDNMKADRARIDVEGMGLGLLLTSMVKLVVKSGKQTQLWFRARELKRKCA